MNQQDKKLAKAIGCVVADRFPIAPATMTAIDAIDTFEFMLDTPEYRAATARAFGNDPAPVDDPEFAQIYLAYI